MSATAIPPAPMPMPVRRPIGAQALDERPGARRRLGGLLTAMAVNGALLAGVWTAAQMVRPTDPPPIEVRFISTPKEALPEPPKPPEPAKPKPVVQARIAPPKPAPPPLPLLATTQQQAPTPVQVAPQPEPPREAPPISAPPATAPAPPAPVSVAPPAPPAPVNLELTDLAVLARPAPDYPAVSKRMGEEGRVIVRLLVATNGQVERAELKASSGSNRLDQAAINALRQWRFAPPKRNGEPVQAWVLVPIKFELDT